MMTASKSAKYNYLYNQPINQRKHYLKKQKKMRLTCEANVIDRTQAQQKSRLLKSIVNIGFHPRNEQNAEMFLLHENGLNKSGRRYRTKLNILKVFTKFLPEGKVTISFKEPPHDLQIRCDKIQLMAFMKTLRMGLGNSNSDIESQPSKCEPIRTIKLPRLIDIPFSHKMHANTKMVVRNRSDLDKGIPRSVQVLCISGLGLHRFHSSILRLQNLSVLNLSDNNLTEIPAGVGYLPLTDINFAENQLSKTNFAWLNQPTIQKSLQSINLSGNQLHHFPAILFKVPKLIIIKLSKNLIERIPFAIRKLKILRELYVDNNNLVSLPDALYWMYFETIDIANNRFKQLNGLSKQDITNRVCVKQNINLTEMCLRRVVQYKLSYTPATLPLTLINLLESAPLCLCGNICIGTPIVERWHEVKLRTKMVVKSAHFPAHADGTFCSIKCVKRYC